MNQIVEENTQEEKIIWHKYPEELPPVETVYLVSEDAQQTRYAVWDGTDFKKNQMISTSGILKEWHVYAWARPPKGWVSETR